MLVEEIKNIKSDKKELKNFGVTIGIVLALIGTVLWWRDKDIYPQVLLIAAVFFLAAFTAPVLLKPFQKIWMTLAVVLGWVMTRIILGILFFIVFTLIGVTGRLLGKQFLEMGIDKNAQTYWQFRQNTEVKREDYERQF